MIHAFKHPIPKPDDRHIFFSSFVFYSLFMCSDIELCSTFEYDLIILLICYSIVLLNVSSGIRNRTFPFHSHHKTRESFCRRLWGTCELIYFMKTVKRRNLIQNWSSAEFNQMQFECNIFLLFEMRQFLLLYLDRRIVLFGALSKLLYQFQRVFWHENKFYLGACLYEELTYSQKKRIFVISSYRDE